MLEFRLWRALEVWRAAPAPLVVSGFEEAEVMADWLLVHGVPESSIVLEPKARSTNENLERSRALFPEAAYLTVVTSGFHVLRTRVWAWHLGIPVQLVAAPTPKTSRVKNYAREVVALPHSVARVVWRRFVRRVLGR